MQGKHLYAIGGERVLSGPATSNDEDEEVECLSDVCQFDEEAKLWMQLPISGAVCFMHRIGPIARV